MWLLFNNLHEKRITDEILAAHTRFLYLELVFSQSDARNSLIYIINKLIIVS